MATYLVDYENVNSEGMMGIEQLSENDNVIVFYSEKANTISFALHERINESKASIKYINVTTGTNNSLDFQLVTYLGYLIAKNGKDEYVIISKDKGFTAAIQFWKKRSISITLAYNLLKQSRNSIIHDIKQLNPQYQDDIPTILNYLEKYKTKQGFNNALTKKFGNEKTGCIYKAVKPLLAEKKGK